MYAVIDFRICVIRSAGEEYDRFARFPRFFEIFFAFFSYRFEIFVVCRVSRFRRVGDLFGGEILLGEVFFEYRLNAFYELFFIVLTYEVADELRFFHVGYV